MLASEKRYYTFVREERLFCALLAHLLLQKGNNLATFIELVNAKLPAPARLPVTGLERAEVYLEFAYLRDYWNSLEQDNVRKRDFIFKLLSQIVSLAEYQSSYFPSTIPEFNAFFMGDRGRAIENDVVYPGQWSVAALAKRVLGNEQFKDVCRFKWSFNIKPDVIILIPGSSPLCVEAKLESREGRYPSNYREAKIFDERFGSEQGRVRQIELQEFMFGKLLRSPCQQIVIGRDGGGYQGMPFLSWLEVFQRLDKTGSLPFVERLIGENIHLSAR